MKCNQCGIELKENAKFCHKCGYTVGNESIQTDCEDKKWFCLINVNGILKKTGPYGLKELRVLSGNGQISRETDVWNEGLPEWIKISETELFYQLKLNKIAPLVKKGLVSNTWVWILAFAPIISTILYQIIGEQYLLSKIQSGEFSGDYKSIINTLQTINIAVAIGLNEFLVWKDEKQLKALGHDTKLLGSFWLIPVYLFKRAKYLNQKPAYAIVWLVSFFLFLW